MDVQGYVRQYSIAGGMEMLPIRLLQSLNRTDVRLDTLVRKVAVENDGTYSLTIQRGARTVVAEGFDAVYIALPHNYLGTIVFEDERVRRAMAAHIAYYDRPGHYLRVSVLFRTPFWRHIIRGSWFMLDAFGGCCVYDEGLRHPKCNFGVLGWLLAGSEALLRGNLGDEQLINLVLDSLPESLSRLARRQFVEVRVHRWAAAVSGQPGGLPVRDPRLAHQPEPVERGKIFLVGDYLFDSTLNGVYESADVATDLLDTSWSSSLSRTERPACIGGGLVTR